MFRVKTALVCEGAALDAQTNNITAYNILDELQSPAFPAAMVLFFVATIERDRADPESPEATLRASQAGYPDTVNTQLPCRFGDKLRTHIVVKIAGLLLSAPGDLVFALRIAGQDVSSYVVHVTQQGQLVLVR